MSAVAQESLSELAEKANGKHREAYTAAMSMLYAGFDAGEALLEAKAQIGHGGWVRWCEENLDFAYSSATTYMLVARQREFLLAQDGVDTMQKAIRCLKAHKLTSQSRIDDEMIGKIRALHTEGKPKTMIAETLGVSPASVDRYVNGNDKTRPPARSPLSGTRTNIDNAMIDRMAAWLALRVGKNMPVNDRLRKLAHEALLVSLGHKHLPAGTEA